MSLADYTQPGLIIPRLRGRDAASVIQELSQALHHEGCVPELLPFYHEVMNREFLASTVMENGLAIPHARLAALKRLTFAFGRGERPIAWGLKGTAPVTLVFLVAVPATDAVNYLALISGLAKFGTEPRLLDQLRATGDGADLFAAFQQIRLRSPGSAGR